MAKSNRNRPTKREGVIMFEPDRLSGEYLVAAYSQVLPLRRRKTQRPVAAPGAAMTAAETAVRRR